jgi:hypothetical protein
MKSQRGSVASFLLLVVPLGLLVGSMIGIGTFRERARVSVDIAPVSVTRDASDRAILTARVTHRDNLDWSNFFVTAAELSNGAPLELVSSYDTARVPRSFDLVFATPAGARVPEIPVLSLHVGLMAHAWYLDRVLCSWSEHTLVFRDTDPGR